MVFKISLFLVAFTLCVNAAVDEIAFEPCHPEKPLRFCKAYASYLAYVKGDTSYVDISQFAYVSLDLRYASFQNVTGHDLYCGANRAYLKTMAAKKLRFAVRLLQKEYPGYRFVIFDASRPVYAQAKLRETVAGSPFSNYVSSSKRGSVHNFGLALDLTVADSNGIPLDMGTDFDSFEKRAGEKGEAEALAQGTLTKAQVENRKLLRRIMKKAGFLPLSSEWWHFNAVPSKTIRATGELPPF